MGDALLNVSSIKSGYGKLEVLHGVSFAINEGKIVSLVGHNGAGKTTALKSIFGLIRIWEGNIFYSGDQIANSPASDNVSRGISYVPQNNNIFSGFSVQENLTLSTHIFKGKLSKEALLGRVEDVFSLFPILKERRMQNAGKLSGGQKQMLAIGMALMQRPKLLLLDEPSIGLAPVLFQNVLEGLKEVNQNNGMSILLVEQNVKKALEFSDYAYVMKLGKIQQSINSEKVDQKDLWEMF